MTNVLYLRCDCHTPYHFLTFEADPDIEGAFEVHLVSTKSASIWHRIKYALRHVVRRESLVEADIILNAEDAERLVAFLQGKAA